MNNNRLWNRLVLAGTMAGGLVLGFAGTARADRDWKEDCSRRLNADRARIDRDASRHGERSRQVDSDVARMNSDRQWCRDHRADWDHSRFDIGIYFGHHENERRDDDHRDDHHEEHH
ncbi:MAG TPA: hypothetical protein VH161_09365 [Candidatus Acidoferrales bacterium]|nr:hypothetical protein [Candidatus Acidoferrales bacterium]